MTDVRRDPLRLAALLSAAALAVGVVLATPPAAHAEDAAVSATGGNAFTPDRVAILVGDSVTWTTTGGVNHTVTSSSANWKKDNEIRVVGQSTTFTFSRAGTYTYYCKTHGAPTTGMRGSVVVTAPSSSRPTPSPTRTSARPTPSPTRSPTAAPRPSPSRTPSARPTPSPTASRPTPAPTVRPTPSRSATPGFVVRPGGPTPTVSAAPIPLPSVAEPEESPDATVDLGSGGLGPPAATGRGRGLPTFLAIVALGGVVSAQVRALLSLPTDG